jgi:hypothetical protein
MKLRIREEGVDDFGRHVQLELDTGQSVFVMHWKKWSPRAEYAKILDPSIEVFTHQPGDFRSRASISEADSKYLHSNDITAEEFIDFVAERVPDPWFRDLLSVSTISRTWSS